MTTQYAIIRINSLKSGDIAGVERHNLRIGPPENNVDSSRTHLNRVIKSGQPSLTNAIGQRIIDAGIKRKVQDTAVLGIELMMTASPEFFDEDMRSGNSEKLDNWIKDSIKYAVELAKDEANIVQIVLHMDEETPHLQIVFVPISADAPTKGKTKKASGELRLNAKPWNSPGKWQTMWTTYAAAMSKYDLKRGEFRQEGEPQKEHKTLKAGRQEVLKTAQNAEKNAERAVEVASRTEDHVHEKLAIHQGELQRQTKKIDTVLKQQAQVIEEQKTLIQTITAQLKQAHETIKRLLGAHGTNTPQTPPQRPAAQDTDPFNPESLDRYGM